MGAKSLLCHLHRLLQPKSSSSPLNHHTVTNLLWSSSCSTKRYFTSNTEVSIVNGTKDDKFDEEEEEEGEVKSGVLNLSTREKRELTSYAYSLGVKLKSQLVGKSGVSDSAVSALMDNLEASELVKIKLHKTCPGEFLEVVRQLQEATGSMVINQIGRTMILYKPSLTKLKADMQIETTFPGEKVKERSTEGRDEASLSLG